MEHGACNVIYTHRRAHDEHIRRETLSDSLIARTSTGTVPQKHYVNGKKPPPLDIHATIEQILSIFSEVHVCASGQACLSKVSQLLDSGPSKVPTLVLIDIPYDEEQHLKRLSREPRSPSPTATRLRRTDTTEPDDIYGIHLLTHVYSEIQSQNLPRLVIPVAVLSGVDRQHVSETFSPPNFNGSQSHTEAVRAVRYLDAGAVDVFFSPLSRDNAHALAVHVYRVQKETVQAQANFLNTKKNRKLSWVGVNDDKPYAYLREAMVSGLMSGICNPESVGDSLDPRDVVVEDDRRDVVAAAIGKWSFSAHDFTDDELLYGALLMLKHALQMPELEHWTISDDELLIFLLASRVAYNDFVLYHNFRHVSDVLQALFFSLVQIGTLPPYPNGSPSAAPRIPSPIAQLLTPFDALTLLISAIGHDVGHPGVNNAFLVALNAPLAQLYNDRSVLESFHCAAYSQILRRYWPKAFADIAMRKLMISNILATDMGLHFKYMTDVNKLQEKLAHEKGVTDGWNDKIREEHRDLACGLLIKCADISNVARKFEVAAKWATILTDEFSNQGEMEKALQVPSCLFGGPPERDNMIKLGQSQTGFIKVFAKPLFDAVADILPGMQFAVDEMVTNTATWEKKIQDTIEKNARAHGLNSGLRYGSDPISSPASEPSLTRSPILDGQQFSDSKTQSNSELSTTGSTPTPDKSSSVPTSARSPPTIPEAQNQDRRGSGDASLTTILVTPTPQLSEPGPEVGRKKPFDDAGNGNGTVRPLTAPSRARHSNAHNLHPLPRSSQSHSDVDLPAMVNGNADGGGPHEWGAAKASADSNMTRSDLSRESARSDWWRLKTRRTRETRNGTTEVHNQHKDLMLEPSVAAGNSHASPTSPNPGRSSRTGKLKTFFKRKPRPDDHERHFPSFGSASSGQLRNPPTSDPGFVTSSEQR